MNAAAHPQTPPPVAPTATAPASYTSAPPAAAVNAPPEPSRAASLGFDGTRAARPGAGAAPDVRASGRVLPELEPEAQKRRKLWRHPAFLVSMGTTLLALIAAAVLMIMGVFGSAGSITELGIERTSGNIRVHWTGTGEPVELFAVGGPSGEVVDLSQRVTGDEAWIPLGALIVDDSTCIVVRPASPDAGKPTPVADPNAKQEPIPQLVVSTDTADLEAQRGASACVADAVDLALPESDEDE